MKNPIPTIHDLTILGLATIKDGKVETNKDFENLSKEIAKATPVGVKMSEYNPTNTAAASCPSITPQKWEAQSSPLPPVPNAQLCSCMTETVSCKVADNTAETDFGEVFGYICGLKKGGYCAGINRNSTAGPFGAYGMCSSKDQLTYALNQYALNVTNGCGFDGKATKVTAKAASSSCQALMNQVGPAGTGTVNSSPQGSSGSKPTGAASGLVIPRFEAGIFSIGLYLGAAVLSGAAMIVL